MSRDKARKLAALACDPSAAEGEATNAARALARLIHTEPTLLDAPPASEALPAGRELDPLVGMVVREGFGLAAELLRDFMKPAPAPKKPAPAFPCLVCGARSASLEAFELHTLTAHPKAPSKKKPPKPRAARVG